MNNLQEILDRIDVGAFLDREGHEYKETHGRNGLQLRLRECPFCGNSDSKVYVNAATGIGSCFAGSHPPPSNFSKLNFLKAFYPDAPFRQFVDHLAQIASEMGWRPARTISAAVTIDKSQWELPRSVELPLKGKNHWYLERRGIDHEYTKYFHLRAAWPDAYFRYKVPGDPDWHFQRYGDRIIIPIYDLDGKLVTFQGRDVTGKAPDKYLFPPGLEGSGCHLYNGFNVHHTKRIAIGEGVFDVIAMKIAFDGEPDTRDVIPVGTFGKHLSQGSDNSQAAKFMKLRERGVEEATFMWDGEIAALDKAIEVGDVLKSMGYRVRIGLLPADKDPNEVPASVVRKVFYEALPLTAVNALTLRMRARKQSPANV